MVSGFRLGFRVQGSELRASGLGCRVRDLGLLPPPSFVSPRPHKFAPCRASLPATQGFGFRL
jgi:hypothetical protein